MVIKKEKKYHYAIGRRKTSIATVRLYEDGKGEVKINNKPLSEYISLGYAVENILRPLEITDNKSKFDVSVKVTGSGLSSQSDAIKLGIAKALVDYDPELRSILKSENLLTRDPRSVERKKPGLHKARRGVQFSKR